MMMIMIPSISTTAKAIKAAYPPIRQRLLRGIRRFGISRLIRQFHSSPSFTGVRTFKVILLRHFKICGSFFCPASDGFPVSRIVDSRFRFFEVGYFYFFFFAFAWKQPRVVVSKLICKVPNASTLAQFVRVDSCLSR